MTTTVFAVYAVDLLAALLVAGSLPTTWADGL